MKKKLLVLLPIAAILAIVLSPTLSVGAEHAEGFEEPEEISPGAYLATIAGCIGCHTPDVQGGGPPVPDVSRLLAGGRDFNLGPLGVLTTRNLTSDEETGIGAWTDEEIKRAITTGVSDDGNQLFPVMPYVHFNTMNEGDVDAIIAFLRTLQPISNEIEESDIEAPPLPPLSYDGGADAPDPSDTAARGQYLIESVIACTDCHTPTDLQTGAPDFSKLYGGGQPFEGPWGIVYAGNITPDVETGLGDWSAEEIKRVLTQGIGPDGRQLVLMPWQEYTHLTDADLDAVVHYLQNGLAPVSNEVPAPDLTEAFEVFVPIPAEETNSASVNADDFVLVAGIVAAVMVVMGSAIIIVRSKDSSSAS